MVALYTRVSTQEQINGFSLDEQTDRMRKYSEAMGWSVYGVYTDAGFSGGNTDRPALQRLIKDVKAGKIDRVLVYKLDRLSRSQKDTLLLIEDVFLAHGCDFVSMSENFDTSTPFGRAMIGILAVFAQLEREQIKERMNMGKDASVKSGRYAGGTPPYGYKYISGEFIPDQYEAMIVREMFEMALTMSPYMIAKKLNASGHTRTTGLWDDQYVSRILTNKAYIGMKRYKKDWYGHHTPIIDEDLFNRVQAIRLQKRQEHEQYNRRLGKANSYLGGYLFCRQCGAKYTKRHMSTIKYGRPYVYDRFCCNSRLTHSAECHNRTWRVDELTDLIFGEIRKLALDPEYISEISDQEDDRPMIIEKEISSITDQMEKLMDLYAVGGMPADVIQSRIHTLNDRRAQLEDSLESIKKENEDRISIDETREIVSSFSDILDRGDFDEIRTVIGALIDRIELDGDDIFIHWSFT